MQKIFVLILLFFQFLTFCRENSQIDRAINLFKEGKLGEIIEKKDEFYETLKGDEKVVFKIIHLLALKKLNREITYEELPKEKSVLSNYYFFELSKQLYSVGKIEESIKFIEKVDVSFFKNKALKFKFYTFKSSLYNKIGDFKKEIEVLTEIESQVGFPKKIKLFALFNKGDTYLKLGEKGKAISIFKKIAFDFDNNPFGSSAFFKLITIDNGILISLVNKEDVEGLLKKLLNIGRQQDAYIIWKSLKPKVADISLITSILYKCRKNEELFTICDEMIKIKNPTLQDLKGLLDGLSATIRVDDEKRAKDYFLFLYSNVEKRSDLYYHCNYTYGSFKFIRGDFEDALNYLKECLDDENFKFRKSAILKCLLSSYFLGRLKESEEFAKRLLPFNDAFSIRATFFLNEFLSKKMEYPKNGRNYYNCIQSQQFKDEIRRCYKEFQESLFRGKISSDSLSYKFYQISLVDYSINEIERISEPLKKEDIWTLNALKSLIGEYIIEFSGVLDKKIGLAFPLAFKEEISKALEGENIEESLLYSICREESKFDPFAYSQTGAIGLFQVMPSTADKFADGEIKHFDLFTPLKNIKVAKKYLNNLRTIFNEDSLTISSYNAGEDIVKRWEKTFSNGTLFLLSIPYLETQDYTERVLFDKLVYEAILSK